ncbi:uncharacterized protein LOC112083033 [Eutrema salsugineum]|uniref:uncharacterized protein LOC112083033 n=1 Tax=Eutrema salsugineum TaxID=72664 RepID=UPI000CED634E|nr:uncharacterized protein LOC112083033 [Eutrema salsugineum]
MPFHDLDFGWASRLVHHILTFQIVCNQRYEIWSLIGTSPVKFSFHEFEEIIGLNCKYVNDLALPELELLEDMRVFLEQMGVNVALGPNTLDNIESCSNYSSWSRNDRLCLGYLGIYAAFIIPTKPGSPTNTSHAKLVVDLKGFKSFPWGRLAFQHLIKDPLPNEQPPLLLAYTGSRGRKNARIQSCMVKDLADMFPVWDDEQQDPNIEGVLGSYTVKVEKKSFPSDESSWKKPCTVAASAASYMGDQGDGVIATMKAHFNQCFKSFSTKMTYSMKNERSASDAELGSCEKQIKLLSDNVEAVDHAVEAVTTRTAKHTDEEVKNTVDPSQQKDTINTRREGNYSEKEDDSKKGDANVGISESVNALGAVKAKQATVDLEENPETSVVELDPAMCDVDFNGIQHMEAYINLLRLRFAKHPKWFWSDRLCFLNSMFATTWRRDYNDFFKSEPNADGSGRLLPPGTFSYYTGELTIRKTEKTWAYEVDHLYSMLHISKNH